MTYKSPYESNFCIEAKWLIPINKNNPNYKTKVIKDTAIVIEDQLIKDILPIEHARKNIKIFLKNNCRIML